MGAREERGRRASGRRYKQKRSQAGRGGREGRDANERRRNGKEMRAKGSAPVFHTRGLRRGRVHAQAGACRQGGGRTSIRCGANAARTQIPGNERTSRTGACWLAGACRSSVEPPLIEPLWTTALDALHSGRHHVFLSLCSEGQARRSLYKHGHTDEHRTHGGLYPFGSRPSCSLSRGASRGARRYYWARQGQSIHEGERVPFPPVRPTEGSDKDHAVKKDMCIGPPHPLFSLLLFLFWFFPSLSLVSLARRGASILLGTHPLDE